jgi:hypothetical protein
MAVPFTRQQQRFGGDTLVEYLDRQPKNMKYALAFTQRTVQKHSNE